MLSNILDMRFHSTHRPMAKTNANTLTIGMRCLLLRLSDRFVFVMAGIAAIVPLS